MISKKLNKQRRRQAFRKLFNPQIYRYVDIDNCLVGQMLAQAGIETDDSRSSSTEFKVTSPMFQQAGKFYGIDPQLLEKVMFGRIDWNNFVGNQHWQPRNAEMALRVFDKMCEG